MKNLLKKLSSRKLWVSVGAVVGCVLTALCGEPDNAAQIVAIVGAVVSAVGYVLGEASVDRTAVYSSRYPTERETDTGFTAEDNDE